MVIIMDPGQVEHQPISNGLQNPILSREVSVCKDFSLLSPMESHNWLIYTHYVRKQVDKATTIIEQQLQRSGNKNEYAHYLLGIIHMDNRLYSKALEQFQICNKLNPNNIDNIKQVGKCLFSQKRYKLALEAFMEAENIAKKLDWEIHYWIVERKGLLLAECLIKLGGQEAALQWSKRSARAGKQLEPCKQLGKLLLQSGDLSGAIEAYNFALQCAPDNAELLTSLGLLYARVGQQQLAVERLGSALAVGPPQATALLPLAAIIQSHGDYEVALSKYKIAAQQTPDCAALWNNIGMCFLGKHKLVAAISCLKRATALSPLSTRILHNLGLVHLMSQQYASSFQFLCAALNLQSTSSSTLMLMAITLDYLQDYGNSLKAYEKALAMSPDDLTLRLNYTLFMYSQKQYELAKYHLSVSEEMTKKLQSLDGEHIEVMHRLKSALSFPVDSRKDENFESEPIYETVEETNTPVQGADDENKAVLDEDEV